MAEIAAPALLLSLLGRSRLSMLRQKKTGINFSNFRLAGKVAIRLPQVNLGYSSSVSDLSNSTNLPLAGNSLALIDQKERL